MNTARRVLLFFMEIIIVNPPLEGALITEDDINIISEDGSTQIVSE